MVQLNLDDVADNFHIVRIVTTFSYNDLHFCLVFERLYSRKIFVHAPFNSPNPYHLTQYLPASAPSAEERRRRERLGIQMIRELAQQIMLSLMLLREHKLLHADIKAENLLFTDESSFKVKLIDFGNAFTLDQAGAYFDSFEVQSLFYRAPEVYSPHLI